MLFTDRAEECGEGRVSFCHRLSSFKPAVPVSGVRLEASFSCRYLGGVLDFTGELNR